MNKKKFSKVCQIMREHLHCYRCGCSVLPCLDCVDDKEKWKECFKRAQELLDEVLSKAK